MGRGQIWVLQVKAKTNGQFYPHSPRCTAGSHSWGHRRPRIPLNILWHARSHPHHKELSHPDVAVLRFRPCLIKQVVFTVEGYTRSRAKVGPAKGLVLAWTEWLHEPGPGCRGL